MAVLFTLTACQQNNEIANKFTLKFDKNDFVLKSQGVDTVFILDNTDRLNDNAWGVESVEIDSSGVTRIIHNETEVKSDDAGNTFNYYADTFEGDVITLRKGGGRLLIETKANPGSDRIMHIRINAGPYGSGYIRVTQKGNI
jgi:hypothetical protein